MPWWDKDDKHADPLDYERKTASRIKGARKTIASGALFGDFDVGGETVLIDNKRVSKGHSYRLDVRDFKKVMDRSTVDQIPAMLINFNEHGESVAVIREADFIAFVNELTDDS